MSKVIGSITGANKVKKATKKAVKAAELQPFQVDTPFGQASIGPDGLNVAGAAGTSLAPGFENAAGAFLQQLQGLGPVQSLGLSPDQVIAAGLGLGQGTADSFLNQGNNFLQGAGGILDSIGSFDPNQFAADRFAALEELAGPVEENAANSLANRLFAQGRLGGEDTRSGRAFGELSQALARARTERGIASFDAAGNELSRRIGQAGSLSGFGSQLGLSGEQIATSQLGRFLSGVQGAGQVQALQGNAIQQLLGAATGATQGIQSAFAPSQNVIQTLLAGSNLKQGGQQAIANTLVQGGQAQGKAFGNLTGSIIGGIFNK